MYSPLEQSEVIPLSLLIKLFLYLTNSSFLLGLILLANLFGVVPYTFIGGLIPFMFPYYTEVLSNLSGQLPYCVVGSLEPDVDFFLFGGLTSNIRLLLAQARLYASYFVTVVLPCLQRGQQFAFKYKFPLGAVYLGVCLYFQLYVRLCITITFLSLLGISQISWVKKWRARYAADCLVIQGHWERDSDLIRLWFYVKACYCGAVLVLLVYCMCLFSEVGVSYNEMGFPLGISWGVWWPPLLALVLVIGGNLAVFVADLHIIWMRNTPAKYQLLTSGAKFGYTSLKLLVLAGAPLVGGMEIITRISVLEPNVVTNNWRVKSPFGPKFGYANQHVRLRHYALTSISGYDPVVYGGKSGILTHHKLDVAVKMNLPEIRTRNALNQAGAGAYVKFPLVPDSPLKLTVGSKEFTELLNAEGKEL